MAAKGIVSILAGYFNTGNEWSTGGKYTTVAGRTITLSEGTPGKRSLPIFRDELKELSDDEKHALALAVCAITGDTVRVG